ncbi:cytochrome P450 [Streptomyces fulvoviolaceus]|uniref:cytochrome P450 n=1 Tax=Streptomyces fulvoviolaceus TaxID=285535 RepID=UPI0021C004AD|nr:cytochrome P450 [Streptomyces fulvoviolaceus]MCT9075739.1 cytochrome P450 [Streptomyces fulvoviolaceus]
MSRSQDEPSLTYPLRGGTALEPPPEWATLRQECPVARVTLPSGDEAALLTRYEDVRQVLSDRRFSRRLTADDAARMADHESGGVFNSDMALAIPESGAAHRRWRRMLGRWLTAERVAALRPGIEARTERLVDDMVEQGHPADLRAHLAFPLPVWVVCELLGVPDAHHDRFARWSDTLLNLTRCTQEEFDAAQDDFVDYLGAQVHARQEEPSDDLLGALVTARDTDGHRLSERELVFTGQALLVAGHETTMNVIAKMVALLLADRRRWERLLADPSLVPTAVEEALRFDADPGVGMPRYLGEEAEIAGTVLPPGTTVLCSAAAANRDESAFVAPGEMALDRSPNPHLAFGAGPQSCLGQALARTVLRTVLDVLLRRLPSLELAAPAADLRRLEGLAVGGLREVPVRW